MFGINNYVLGGAAALFLLMGGWLYVSRAEVKAEKAENARITQQLNDQTAVLNNVKNDLALQRSLNAQIQNRFQTAQVSVSALRTRLNQLQLRRTAIVEPSAAQLIINRDTAWTLRCNELATGSPVAETDANNEICPELIDAQ